MIRVLCAVGGVAGACCYLIATWFGASPPRDFQACCPVAGASLAEQPSLDAVLATKTVAARSTPIHVDDSLVRSETPREAQTVDHVLLAQRELETQINDSLDGFFYVNDVLDHVQAFAELPVDPRVDLEYDDDDAVAFKIQGTPPGTVAHFLVGRRGFERDGKKLKALQMEIEVAKDESPVFYRDSMRYGPRVHMTIDYDEEAKPDAFAIILQRDVALKESRREGVNAYQGTYTAGAGYRVNFGRQSSFSGNFGLVDGRVVDGDKFPGISPLIGDTAIDGARVQALLDALMRSRLAVANSVSEPK